MRRAIAGAGGAIACMTIGALIGIGVAGHPHKAVYLPAPGTHPAAAKSAAATPKPLPTGQLIGTWDGRGPTVTDSFPAPSSGNYTVTWHYSGNSDQYGPSNFIIEPTDSLALSSNLPNDMQDSGSGSTEITDVTPGAPEAFNVQALKGAHWTITVKTAP